MKQSKALLEQKQVEIKKKLHYLNNNNGSEEEKEYYCGMFSALAYVLDVTDVLWGYNGRML